jgi:hypothetical protein
MAELYLRSPTSLRRGVLVVNNKGNFTLCLHLSVVTAHFESWVNLLSWYLLFDVTEMFRNLTDLLLGY